MPNIDQVFWENLFKLATQIFSVVGIVAVAYLGYKQYRSGKRQDDIGSAAEHIVTAADKLVDMKDEEIEKLSKRIEVLSGKVDQYDVSMQKVRNERERDRMAIISLTEEVSLIKIELRRADDSLEFLVSATKESFPEAVETAWKIRRGEIHI